MQFSVQSGANAAVFLEDLAEIELIVKTNFPADGLKRQLGGGQQLLRQLDPLVRQVAGEGAVQVLLK